MQLQRASVPVVQEVEIKVGDFVEFGVCVFCLQSDLSIAAAYGNEKNDAKHNRMPTFCGGKKK